MNHGKSGKDEERSETTAREGEGEERSCSFVKTIKHIERATLPRVRPANDGP